MELKGLELILLGAISAIGAWFYKLLYKRIDEMEIDIAKRPDRSEIRMLLSDKLAPLQVEYHALSNRLEDLKQENHKINNKVDRLLEICSKLENARK